MYMYLYIWDMFSPACVKDSSSCKVPWVFFLRREHFGGRLDMYLRFHIFSHLICFCFKCAIVWTCFKVVVVLLWQLTTLVWL